jgi:hypothetical protein
MDDDGQLYIDPPSSSDATSAMNTMFKHITISPISSPTSSKPSSTSSPSSSSPAAKPTGVAECHSFLRSCQRSVWHSLVLKHLQRDASSSPPSLLASMDVLVGEDEVSFSATSKNRVSVKLVAAARPTSPQTSSLGGNSMTQRLLDVFAMDLDRPDDDFESSKTGHVASRAAGLEYALIEVALHQLLRSYHKKFLADAHRIVVPSHERIAFLQQQAAAYASSTSTVTTTTSNTSIDVIGSLLSSSSSSSSSSSASLTATERGGVGADLLSVPLLVRLVEVSGHVFVVEEMKKLLEEKVTKGVNAVCTAEGGLSVVWKSSLLRSLRATESQVTITFPVRFANSHVSTLN